MAIISLNMLARAKNRRAEERKLKNTPIRFSDSFVMGITCDVSDSGLSFRAHQPIENKMVVKLSCDFLWNAPREGIVRWCSKIYPGIYKVGIALI